MSTSTDIPSMILPESLHIHVGESCYAIGLEELLPFFWGDNSKVDGHCVVCYKEFEAVLGPPIRTFSMVMENYKHGDFSHIRIHNRHMKCLQETRVNYSAISHVWHDPVRIAHETKEPYRGGVDLVYKMPLRVLLAATRAFPEDTVEVWHDYWSVPQWRFEIQQQILLFIPVIYSYPKKILVQLEDYDPKHIQLMLEFGPVLDADMRTTKKLEERYQAVVAYFQSVWTKRMWVSLEFVRSKRACLLDSKYHIWRHADSARGSFSQLNYECQRNCIMVYDLSHDEKKDYIGSLRYVNRGQDVQSNGLRCFGDTLDDFAMKECKYYRDRFVGIYASLEKDSFKRKASAIPKDDIGACEWVWKQALESGDYSPLLLQPNGDKEKEAPGLSWLVGHSMMNGFTWDLGRPLSIPQGHTIIRDGFVEPELEHVGLITKIDIFNLSNEDTLAGLDTLMEMYMNLGRWNIPSFVSMMERVYPINSFFEKYAREGLAGYNTLPHSLEQYISQDPDFEGKLTKILTDYHQAIKTKDSVRRAVHTAEIADLMQLNSSFGPMANDVRLHDAKQRAKWRQLRDSGANEPICTVACQYCQQTSIYKLDLRVTGEIGAKVYRIPGLNFTVTVEEGVGIVVLDGRVVGRMRYGTPACNCRKLEIVRLV